MTTTDTPRKMWAGAPSLIQIEACQQGGKRGAQLWGVQQNYKLNSTFQVTPGGNWSEWIGPNWNGMNQQVFDIAGALQNNGNVQLWVLDNRQQLYSISQNSPGGNWGQWSGPNWSGAPRMNAIGAAQQGGPRGAQLWGVTENQILTSTYQITPGGNWSPWQDWQKAPRCKDVAASGQNDGRLQLFVIDLELQLWIDWQTSPGGSWVGIQQPNWNNAPKMWNVCAAQQGGPRGGQVWGITRDYKLVTCYQGSPGGNWSGWQDWANTPQVVEIAAAGQNNGCVQLWAITSDGALISTKQTSPGGNWTGWETEVEIDFQGNPMTDNRRRDRP
ncbi:MAG TPA: hypothetical protein VF240_22570 [Pyrinomonadaceae bacterium]